MKLTINRSKRQILRMLGEYDLSELVRMRSIISLVKSVTDEVVPIGSCPLCSADACPDRCRSAGSRTYTDRPLCPWYTFERPVTGKDNYVPCMRWLQRTAVGTYYPIEALNFDDLRDGGVSYTYQVVRGSIMEINYQRVYDLSKWLEHIDTVINDKREYELAVCLADIDASIECSVHERDEVHN